MVLFCFACACFFPVLVFVFFFFCCRRQCCHSGNAKRRHTLQREVSRPCHRWLGPCSAWGWCRYIGESRRIWKCTTMYRLGLDNLCIEHYRLHRSIYFCVSIYIYIFCSRSLVNTLLCVNPCISGMTQAYQAQARSVSPMVWNHGKTALWKSKRDHTQVPYCQAACFQAYHECCTIYFIHRCPIYVWQACIRSCMIWDPCQTCKIPHRV